MDYLTVKEVAELKGCSDRYVKTLCKTGKLQAEQHTSTKQRYVLHDTGNLTG